MGRENYQCRNCKQPSDNIDEENFTRISGERKGNFPMQRVLVLDSNKQSLMPCQPARARELLSKGKASVYRRYPFTIILKDRVGGEIQPIQFKVDPGSKVSGLALVGNFNRGNTLLWAANLEHRGQLIKNALESRRSLRTTRRNRKTRYRPARFNNRCKEKGWLAPSLNSRVGNIETWLKRLSRFSPIESISMELVKFDTQALQNPEVNGVEYQQGELFGYEVREYLLEKWGRQCVYCGKKNVPFEVEHIVPKSRGGSNRISNLTLSCHDCNQEKGNQTAEEFGFPEIQKLAKLPLKDAAAVNATRWKLYRVLGEFGFNVEVGTGGRTKFNRIQQGFPKDHWIDASCVGVSGESVYINSNHKPINIKATGRGRRQMCQTDKYGFPKQHRSRKKIHFGFQTGNMVIAVVPKGKHKGIHTGKVVCRANGSFGIVTSVEKKDGINQRYFRNLHRADGYSYS